VLNTIALLDTKRRGGTHTRQELLDLVSAAHAGTMPDYQVSAWLMAACIQGLSLDETVWLTEAFIASGQTLDLSAITRPVIDKHSTGGVGDKTTLILVPLLAAAGAVVAKLSGRGLGFTGGTIDKLEAIPGFKTSLSSRQFMAQLGTIGMAISSQTADLAPADAQFYALRDVTATVDNLSLIAASVVSKKIAAGAGTIVLDIKYGRGAFMKTLPEARQLADLCQAIATHLGRAMETVISSMEAPLGLAVGNAVEIVEAVATLKGQGPADVTQLCLHLGAKALVRAGLHQSYESATVHLQTLLDDGSAYRKLVALVEAQGGDVEALDDPCLLPQPRRISFVPSPQGGFVRSIDSLAIAQVVKLLGGGRSVKGEALDLSVGVVLHKKVGDPVEKGETLAELYVGATKANEALTLLQSAYQWSPEPLLSLPCLWAEEAPVTV
jgi:pyrimidine-nucleoside phosphorylase